MGSKKFQGNSKMNAGAPKPNVLPVCASCVYCATQKTPQGNIHLCVFDENKNLQLMREKKIQFFEQKRLIVDASFTCDSYTVNG